MFDPTTSLTSEQRDLIGIIKSSGQAMLILINDILDLSKIEAGKIELEESDVQIRECVESTIDVVAQKALSKGLDVIAQISTRVPWIIRCDATRLKQILFNLLSNAVKFTAAGQVVISVDAAPSEHSKEHGEEGATATTTAETTSGTTTSSSSSGGVSHLGVHSELVSPRLGLGWFLLRVEVVDSGIGISATAQQRLFTSFSQAHREINGKYGGTGLGLAISKSLVELLGGKIGLLSAPGKGSTFFFELKVRGMRLQDVSATQLPPHLHLPSHMKAAALLRLQQEQTQQSLEGNTEMLRLTASAAAQLAIPSPRRRSALLIHCNPVVSALLRTMLEELDLDVTVASSFDNYRATSGWTEAQPIPFHIIFFDAASTLAAQELPVVTSLFQLTRAGSPGGHRETTLVAFLPLGSTRRALESCTDSIVTQPIKVAHLYAAAHRPQLPVVQVSASPENRGRTLTQITVPMAAASATSSNTHTPLFSPLLSSATPPIAMTPNPLTSPSPSLRSVPSKRPAAVLIPLHQLSTFALSFPLRILIAEDNSINQRLISKMLTRLGYLATNFRLTGDGQSCAEEIQRENAIKPNGGRAGQSSTETSTEHTPKSAASDGSRDGKDVAASAAAEPAAHMDSLSVPGRSGFVASPPPSLPAFTAVAPYELVLMDLQVRPLSTHTHTRTLHVERVACALLLTRSVVPCVCLCVRCPSVTASCPRV